jgi:hypothetical protein
MALRKAGRRAFFRGDKGLNQLVCLTSVGYAVRIGDVIADRCHLNSTQTPLNQNYSKVGQEMGAILDLVEKMRTPTGIIVTILIIAVGVFFVRWVFADDQEQK